MEDLDSLAIWILVKFYLLGSQQKMMTVSKEFNWRKLTKRPFAVVWVRLRERANEDEEALKD